MSQSTFQNLGDPVHFDDKRNSLYVVSQHPRYLFCSVMHFASVATWYPQ